MQLAGCGRRASSLFSRDQFRQRRRQQWQKLEPAGCLNRDPHPSCRRAWSPWPPSVFAVRGTPRSNFTGGSSPHPHFFLIYSAVFPNRFAERSATGLRSDQRSRVVDEGHAEADRTIRNRRLTASFPNHLSYTTRTVQRLKTATDLQEAMQCADSEHKALMSTAYDPWGVVFGVPRFGGCRPVRTFRLTLRFIMEWRTSKIASSHGISRGALAEFDIEEFLLAASTRFPIRCGAHRRPT